MRQMCVCVCVSVCMYICLYVCMYLSLSCFLPLCVCVCVWMCVCGHARAWMCVCALLRETIWVFGKMLLNVKLMFLFVLVLFCFLFFSRHSSSLVCMVGITYVYICTVLGFFVVFVFFYCIVGCLSMIVWTSAVLGVLYACVLYLHLFSAIEHISHGKALQKYAHYYYYYYHGRKKNPCQNETDDGYISHFWMRYIMATSAMCE